MTTAQWEEIRDNVRLWCKLDAQRCLLEIVHRGEVKKIDLTEYGLTFVGKAPKSAEKESDNDRRTKVQKLRGQES